MMSLPLRVPQSTKLLYLTAPESYDLWHTPSLHLHTNLMLMSSIHRQYCRMALWDSLFLFGCLSSPPLHQVGLVYLPGEYRIKKKKKSVFFFLSAIVHLWFFPTEWIFFKSLFHKNGDTLWILKLYHLFLSNWQIFIVNDIIMIRYINYRLIFIWIIRNCRNPLVHPLYFVQSTLSLFLSCMLLSSFICSFITSFVRSFLYPQ